MQICFPLPICDHGARFEVKHHPRRHLVVAPTTAPLPTAFTRCDRERDYYGSRTASQERLHSPPSRYSAIPHDTTRFRYKPISPDRCAAVRRAGSVAIQSWLDDSLRGKSCTIVRIGEHKVRQPWDAR